MRAAVLARDTGSLIPKTPDRCADGLSSSGKVRRRMHLASGNFRRAWKCVSLSLPPLLGAAKKPRVCPGGRANGCTIRCVRCA